MLATVHDRISTDSAIGKRLYLFTRNPQNIIFKYSGLSIATPVTEIRKNEYIESATVQDGIDPDSTMSRRLYLSTRNPQNIVSKDSGFPIFSHQQ